MDSRIYFHQYRKPRYSNPTYTSSNVGHSLSFFNGRTVSETPPNKPNSYNFDPSPVTTSAGGFQLSSSGRDAKKLSGYGERSLQMDQRGIVNRQSSKYDIINNKPVGHSHDIKQYPWLTVENRDDVYYRRMNQIYGKPQTDRQSSQQQQPQIAGRHTYKMENKAAANPERQSNRQEKFTAKMLNHMDEIQHSLA